jgi:hypothetical protein
VAQSHVVVSDVVFTHSIAAVGIKLQSFIVQANSVVESPDFKCDVLQDTIGESEQIAHRQNPKVSLLPLGLTFSLSSI